MPRTNKYIYAVVEENSNLRGYFGRLVGFFSNRNAAVDCLSALERRIEKEEAEENLEFKVTRYLNETIYKDDELLTILSIKKFKANEGIPESVFVIVNESDYLNRKGNYNISTTLTLCESEDALRELFKKMVAKCARVWGFSIEEKELNNGNSFFRKTLCGDIVSINGYKVNILPKYNSRELKKSIKSVK